MCYVMILIFYNKYTYVYRAVHTELIVLRRKKTLEQVTKIFIAMVENVSHSLGITVL